LPALKKRAPRRLSPEQKLANKLKRKPRTTAYLASYMHAVRKKHAKIIEFSKEYLDKCMSPTEIVAPANLKEDHVTQTEDLEWAQKGLAEHLVAACDYICDDPFDTLGVISNFGVEWSP
jgi:uridine kinase